MNTADGNISSLTNKESSLEQTVSGLSSTVSNVQQNYLTKSDVSTMYATTSQISSLSQTVNGLSSTVSNTKTEIDTLQVGGRNLLINSAWLKNYNSWYFDGNFSLNNNEFSNISNGADNDVILVNILSYYPILPTH